MSSDINKYMGFGLSQLNALEKVVKNDPYELDLIAKAKEAAQPRYQPGRLRNSEMHNVAEVLAQYEATLTANPSDTREYSLLVSKVRDARKCVEKFSNEAVAKAAAEKAAKKAEQTTPAPVTPANPEPSAGA